MNRQAFILLVGLLLVPSAMAADWVLLKKYPDPPNDWELPYEVYFDPASVQYQKPYVRYMEKRDFSRYPLKFKWMVSQGQLNCQTRQYRMLSLTRYKANGEIFEAVSQPGSWHNISNPSIQRDFLTKFCR